MKFGPGLETVHPGVLVVLIRVRVIACGELVSPVLRRGVGWERWGREGLKVVWGEQILRRGTDVDLLYSMLTSVKIAAQALRLKSGRNFRNSIIWPCSAVIDSAGYLPGASFHPRIGELTWLPPPALQQHS